MKIKRLIILSACALTLVTGCSAKGQESAAPAAAPAADDDALPVFVHSRDDKEAFVFYWADMEEPVKEGDNDRYYDSFHLIWQGQEDFRKNASQYTRMFMEDGSSAKVKFRKEEVKNPDGGWLNVGQLHYRPEIPNCGAFYDVVKWDDRDKADDEPEYQWGVIVSDQFLNTHKRLPVDMQGHFAWEDNNPLPAEIVRLAEQKYGMKAERSSFLGRVGDRYTFGSVQFKGPWENGPKDPSCPDAKQCLALDVLYDGQKIYVKENRGYYDDEESYGWNVDDEGVYSGAPLVAAFEGNAGPMLCYYHPAPESMSLGILGIDGDKLVNKFQTTFQSMVDEEIPVWKKDIAEMQRLFIQSDPSEFKDVKFTKWAHIYPDYDHEWIWVTDDGDPATGGIFRRDDGKFTFITSTGRNRTPSYGVDDPMRYICVSGSAGGPAYYTEIYGFNEGRFVQKFTCLEIMGKIDECTLNGEPLSPAEGNAFRESLPEFHPIEAFFQSVNP